MSDSRFNWTTAALLALLCVMSYVNTLDGEWVWDDVSSVLLHEHVQEPGKLFQLFREDQHAFGRGQGNFYRPLVAASFMADYALSGGPRPGDYDPRTAPEVSPFLFHVTNLLWHLLAALLFLILLIKLDAPRFVRMAAPLVFVVHPLHTEAVAYISGRADMMSASALFGALCFAVVAVQNKRPVIGTFGATLCFVGGLLSKESTLVYPLLLVLMLPLMNTRKDGPAVDSESGPRTKAALVLSAVAVLGGYLALRATVLRFAEGGDSAAAPLSQRLFETLQSLGVYGRLLFVPTGLHMERVLDHVPAGYALAGALFLLVLLGTIVMAWRGGQKRIAAGAAWFLISWLPISGIFPLNAPLAEHWMYVPMAGFWWALLEGAHLALKNAPARRLAYAVVCGVCLAFSVMTAHRNRDWHDNEKLFRATLHRNPDTARIHHNLAVTYETIDRNYAGARRHYEAIIALRARERQEMGLERAAIRDDEIEARLSLGGVLLRLGEYTDAANTLAPLIQLAEVEALQSTAATAAIQTGQAMLALGEINQANYYFDQALRMDPRHTDEIETIMSGAPFHDGY